MEGLTITSIGGNCPVQAYGTIDGKHFYFRARGVSWSLGIADSPDDAILEDTASWYRERVWTDDEYAAGWMPEDEAIRLIEQAAADYIAGGADDEARHRSMTL